MAQSEQDIPSLLQQAAHTQFNRRGLLKLAVAGSALMLVGCNTSTSGENTGTFPLNPEINLPFQRQENSWKLFQQEYGAWKDHYLIDGHNGKKRVLYDPQLKNTAAEVQGYGMLYAVNVGDSDTFNQLWRYIKQYRNAHGTISWLIHSDGSVADSSSAFDSTQDIASALLSAEKKWPGNGYGQEASRLLEASYNAEVEHPSAIPKGGDYGGGSSLTDPSYYDPYNYRVLFARQSSHWADVGDAADKVLDAVGQNIDAKELASFPDWVDASGNAVGGPNNSGPKIGYDSTRIPQRQLRAVLALSGDQKKHALLQLQRYNAFYENLVTVGPGKFDITKIVDGYDVSGRPISFDTHTAFASAAVVASVVSGNTAYTDYMFGQLQSLKVEYTFNYYMWLNALLAISGKNI